MREEKESREVEEDMKKWKKEEEVEKRHAKGAFTSVQVSLVPSTHRLVEGT